MKTILAAIFIFLLVILVHEFGHFIMAKAVGIKVNEFSIGMGPKIIQKKGIETKYTLRLFPIGGYVAMEGEDEDSKEENSFNSASPLSRILVLFAGAGMNFILAILVLTIVSYSTGIAGNPTTIVNKAIEGLPAYESGLKHGDEIIEINGETIENWEELIEKVESSDNTNMEIKYIDGNDKIEKKINLVPEIEGGRKIIGISPIMKQNFKSGLKGGLSLTKQILSGMFNFLEELISGNLKEGDVSGPVGIITEINSAAKMGVMNVLLLLGMISINLGFLNLLPIPALDGSKILLILIEIIIGKEIDEKFEIIINLMGFVFLIGLMIFITYKDILRLIKK